MDEDSLDLELSVLDSSGAFPPNAAVFAFKASTKDPIFSFTAEIPSGIVWILSSGFSLEEVEEGVSHVPELYSSAKRWIASLEDSFPIYFSKSGIAVFKSASNLEVSVTLPFESVLDLITEAYLSSRSFDSAMFVTKLPFLFNPAVVI